MGLFAFMGEVVNIFAIFPQTHTLVVVFAIVTVTDTMRIANEERTYLILHTEVDDLPRGLVSLVTDTPFSTSALRVFGMLEFLPMAGILGTLALLLGNASELFRALSLEGTNTAPRDNHGFPCIGCHRRKMNFS